MHLHHGRTVDAQYITKLS